MPESLRGKALTLSFLKELYRSGTVGPELIAEEVLSRIGPAGEERSRTWIHLDEQKVREAAAQLSKRRSRGESLPLYGVPFAVKDNIDVSGMPTTTGCPALSRMASADAHVVSRLIAAGALLVGKTNLDQLATGLVGARSPYGVAPNPFNPRMIPGGSSSGSAVSVSSGQVTFALGTDTAGSGRVPAGFTNIVGLKPSRGLLSTSGVVPACRSLDCVSVFALTVEDAAAVAEVAKGFDSTDPYSRSYAEENRFAPRLAPASFRFGVPSGEDLVFFGDTLADQAFANAVRALERLGGRAVPIDFAAFRDTGRLLYDGPWVAERLVAGGDLLSRDPEALLPVIREILSEARSLDAVAAFRGFYELESLRRATGRAWDLIDVLVVPTAPTIYSVDEVRAEPRKLNARLGVYTNFVNLLDLAALAVPASMRPDGLPSGITLIGPHGTDAWLASLGSTFQRATGLPLGHTGETQGARCTVAVVGAHLSGLPLNHQLRDAGASLVRTCRTAPVYRLYALPATTPPKPGMVRVDPTESGHAIEVEVWSVPSSTYGAFVAGVPSPLSIGTILLDDGTSVQGFLCEPFALAGATDISHHGGWRAYLREKK
jgi:allophanate hydrolase